MEALPSNEYDINNRLSHLRRFLGLPPLIEGTHVDLYRPDQLEFFDQVDVLGLPNYWEDGHIRYGELDYMKSFVILLAQLVLERGSLINRSSSGERYQTVGNESTLSMVYVKYTVGGEKYFFYISLNTNNEVYMLEVDQGNLRLTHFYDPSITNGEVHINGGFVDPNDPYKSVFPNIQQINLVDSSHPKGIIDADGFRKFAELVRREYL